MKIKEPSEAYLAKAARLSAKESERMLSRMTGKLPRRLEKEKLTQLEALAIQLELEDEMLKDWRERMEEIRTNNITALPASEE
ncbi:hypothetical protein GALL_335710 [mine drainage metagenome]|uniref:Uncharacterized protein n=1 Tax=mine drainage metagenome TaxID=410659 RepID=A0A1J5QXY7_9ZZZZ